MLQRYTAADFHQYAIGLKDSTFAISAHMLARECEMNIGQAVCWALSLKAGSSEF